MQTACQVQSNYCMLITVDSESAVLRVLAGEKVGANGFDMTGTVGSFSTQCPQNSNQVPTKPLCLNDSKCTSPLLQLNRNQPQTLQPCIHEAGVAHVD